MTIAELSEIVGVSIGYLSQIERGIIERVNGSLLRKIAKALNCQVIDLLVVDEALEGRATDLIKSILEKPRPAPEVIVLVQEDIERMKALLKKD